MGMGLRVAGLLALTLATFDVGVAMAGTLSQFDCSVAGGTRLTVTVSGTDGAAVLDDAFGPHALIPQGGGVIAGQRADGTPLSFDEGRQVIFVGSEQFNCRRVAANSQPGLSSGQGLAVNQKGQSLGGKLRVGPGTQYARAGSLAEGTRITILRNTGVRIDGYDWFEIATRNGTRGYQWGGIMCSNGNQIDGIYSVCPSTAKVSGVASRGWLVFAIGNNGRWGHGAGPTRQAARAYAISNCGRADCRIEAETQSRCQALAFQSNGGVWFGDAPTEANARANAMGFCQNAGGQCRIEYSYCQ